MFSYSQQKDSTEIEDSLRIYKKIKKISGKYFFTRWLYQSVFVDPEPKEYPVVPATNKKKM